MRVRRNLTVALAVLCTSFTTAGIGAAGAAGAAGAVRAVGAVGAAGAATAQPGVNVSGARATEDGRVSVIAEVQPAPATPLASKDVTVKAAGATLSAAVQPLLSERSSLSIVVDASAQSAESVAGGGLSGVASFLLQAPTMATLSVVADQSPPLLVAPPAVGVSIALTAASRLLGSGDRATSDALTLALAQSRPGLQSVVVLYTAAPDAGGESARALAQRVRAAGAVLAVVTTASRTYWSTVAESTGGLALSARAARAIEAFDRLSDGVRSRSVIAFPRPAGAGPITVSVQTAHGPATASFDLPSDVIATDADRAASTGGVAWWVWGLVAILVLSALAVGSRFVRLPVSDGTSDRSDSSATVLDRMAGSPRARDMTAQVLAARKAPEPEPPPTDRRI